MSNAPERRTRTYEEKTATDSADRDSRPGNPVRPQPWRVKDRDLPAQRRRRKEKHK